MKHVIVQVFEKSSVVLVSVVLLIGLIGGYAASGVGTAIVGLIMALVFSVFFLGILFIQLEMNESLRAIRKSLKSRQP